MSKHHREFVTWCVKSDGFDEAYTKHLEKRNDFLTYLNIFFAFCWLLTIMFYEATK